VPVPEKPLPHWQDQFIVSTQLPPGVHASLGQ
jgi:hypothetical protein